MNNKCDGCGLTATIVDSYVLGQDPYSKEPPKEIRLCQTCVDEDVKLWKNLGWMPIHQVKAAYEERLAKDMGFVWKENSITGNGTWLKPVKIKKGKFVIEEIKDDELVGIDKAD